MKPRIRVKAPTLMFGAGVPDDAQAGDLVIGNRGALARVIQPPSIFGGVCACLTLEYAGNWYVTPNITITGRMHDFSGGTRP